MLRYGTVTTRRRNKLSFTAVGPPETARPAILLVHPINMRKECWLGLLPQLAQDRLCVSVDLAGHGESSDDDQFSLDGWVSDCVDVATSLELGAFHAVGGSLGGAIALGLAGEMPDDVLSVCAMGTYLRHDDDLPTEGPDAVSLLDASSTDELFSTLAVEAIAPGSPSELATTVRQLTNTHGRGVVRRILVTAQSADASRWAPDVVCPVLVLNGEHDRTSPPEGGARMAAAVGGVHAVLPGVGHLPMIEAPDDVLEALAPHLAAADEALAMPRGAS